MKAIKNNNDIIKGKNILLFATPNCKPCKNMKQVLEQLEKDHLSSAEINFYFIDATTNTKLASKYNIKSVPTTIFKNDDDIKDRFAGFIDNADLENKLINLIFGFEGENGIDFNSFNL